MKCTIATVATLLALASGVTFAATPTTEPLLPVDITSWKKLYTDTCNTRIGKPLVVTLHQKGDGDLKKDIRVMTLNDEKIYQVETLWNLKDTPHRVSSYVYYVRNSREKNWLVFTWKEVAQGDAQMTIELGLWPWETPCKQTKKAK